MKIATFNLRVRWDNDGINSFIHRVGLIYEKISAEAPDVAAFQEVKPRHLELLQKLMPEYWFVGQPSSETGEGVYTAVRRSECQLCGSETFWLGPDIHLPGSRFDGQSKHARTCQVTLVRHRKSGQMLRIYNVHLDHINSEIAAKGMQCVLRKLEADSRGVKADIVLLGDFNETPDGAALVLCKGFRGPPLTEITGEIPYTYHGFGAKAPIKIDYIFVSEGLAGSVRAVRAWEDQKNGIYLSDHYPICVEIELG